MNSFSGVLSITYTILLFLILTKLSVAGELKLTIYKAQGHTMARSRWSSCLIRGNKSHCNFKRRTKVDR